MIRKNTELNAINEELTASEEELHQNIEELALREQELQGALAEKEVLLRDPPPVEEQPDRVHFFAES